MIHRADLFAMRRVASLLALKAYIYCMASMDYKASEPEALRYRMQTRSSIRRKAFATLLIKSIPTAGWQTIGAGLDQRLTLNTHIGKRAVSDVKQSESERKYGTAEYWNQRYAEEPDPFDWLGEYSDVRDHIEGITKGSRSSRILHVGCGNSELTEQMYDNGYHNIVNIDYSEVVISQMQQRNRNRSKMIWSVMDATSMTYSNDSFDLVIDKGVLDAFSCMTAARLTIATYLKEVFRVLRPGGGFVCISFGEPAFRRNHIINPMLEWTCKETEIESLAFEGMSVCACICQVSTSEGKNDRLLERWREVHKQPSMDQ